MRAFLSIPVLSALLLPAAAHAQDVQALVLEGDTVPGIGNVTSIENLALNESLDWLVEVDTNNADTDADGALLRNGVVAFREGDPLTAPAGATLDSFDAVTIDADGHGGFNFFLDGTSGFSDDSGVYLDGGLIVQESDLVDSMEVSPGTPYVGFFEVKIGPGEELLVTASVDDPAINSSVDRALVVLSTAGGAYSSTDVLWKEGDVLPGQTEAIADFGTGPHNIAFQGGSQVLFFADLTGDTSADGVVYLDSTELAQEGDPSPVPARNWSLLSNTALGLGAAGDWVFSGSLDGDSASNLLIVKNGAKFAQEGDPVPGVPGFTLTGFGTGPLLVSDGGRVLWFGAWNDVSAHNEGLFVDDEPIVLEGVTTVDGHVIATLRGIQDGYAFSPNGGYVLFEAILDDGREGAFLYRLPIGQRYCSPAVANSTGRPARITALGSAVAGGHPLTLQATGLPPNKAGYFLTSMTQGASTPPGSQGVLCVSGTVGRFAKSAMSSGPAGAFTLDVDTNALPTNPPSVVQPGETWNFTTWYRDKNPGPTSNFTDAVAVLFE